MGERSRPVQRLAIGTNKSLERLSEEIVCLCVYTVIGMIACNLSLLTKLHFITLQEAGRNGTLL